MNLSHNSTEEILKRINSQLTIDLWEETDSSFDFELEVPGFSKPEIHITSKGNLLNITATPNQKNKRKAFAVEYKLPSSANLSDVSAILENGILNVSVPKKEQEKAKIILIK